MSRRVILVVLGCATLGACNVGPDYKTPAVPVPATFQESSATQAAAPLSRPVDTTADIAVWWSQLQDSELDRLIAGALEENLDVQSAASRVRQARQQEIIAGAAELPTVSATGVGLNTHSNSNFIGKLTGAPSSQTDMPANMKLYSAGFDASWEIDIFGGTRRAMEAAAANTEASLWGMRDAEVTLTAEIAADYLALRAAQARIALLRQQSGDQQVLFNIIRARANAGFVTHLDVNQQQTLVSTTQAEIPQLEAQVRIMAHALAVLSGRQPESLTAELAAPTGLPPIPATLPVGLPSDLLRRRPDIREAERKLAAATAQIGVAVADLYPKFDLTGLASFTSNHLSNLLVPGSFGTIGLAQISWPIFEAGKIHANIRANEEQQLQAYLAYRKAVLSALEDAEDALARYTTEQRRLLATREAAAAATSSVAIAQAQYRAGLTPFINVLTAQTNSLSSRDQLVQSQQALATDLASLFKALGGGWSATAVNPDTRPATPLAQSTLPDWLP
ncbi:MAG TPA: efflux transporter outer membrane subunit [Rhizomicrobium sp.]